MAVVSGTTKDASGAFISRCVRLYRRSDGAFSGQAVSNATTGAYSITALDSTPHFVVEHDGTVIEGDAYWGNVVAALRMDGADGSTTFTDENGNAFSAMGGAQISTAQYAPLTGNTASAKFTSSGDGVKATSTALGTLGAGDFSIELRVRFTAYPLADGGGWYRSILIGKTLNDDEWSLLVYGSSSSIDVLQFRIRQNPWPEPAVSHSFALNTWYHIEVSRVSGRLYFFVDGTLKNAGGTANSQNITTTSSPLVIGRGENTGYVNQTFGYIDDVRITVGVGRHSASFTPSSLPIPNGPDGIGAPTENALIIDYLTPG